MFGEEIEPQLRHADTTDLDYHTRIGAATTYALLVQRLCENYHMVGLVPSVQVMLALSTLDRWDIKHL